MKKILLLGSGELGKEFVIAAMRAGQYVIACDRYDNAPAMQVADEREVFSMLDGDALEAVVKKHQPDIIVPEIEAIRTERLFKFEEQGIQVVPSARAVNYTMNRRAIRDLAAKELGLRTAKYFYAKTFEEFKAAADEIGFPCVVKPLMSSSGHGQSYVHNDGELEQAFREAMEGSRGDVKEVIIEEFIDFDSEFTLLTVTQQHGWPTLFCPPIGHVQKSGDYRESWQPYKISDEALKQAQMMADKVTKALTGAGIWGVEFFLTKQGEVIFSELSPRPHDTGMVTLGHTINLSEFELHLRAVLATTTSSMPSRKTAPASASLASPRHIKAAVWVSSSATVRWAMMSMPSATRPSVSPRPSSAPTPIPSSSINGKSKNHRSPEDCGPAGEPDGGGADEECAVRHRPRLLDLRCAVGGASWRSCTSYLRGDCHCRQRFVRCDSG